MSPTRQCCIEIWPNTIPKVPFSYVSSVDEEWELFGPGMFDTGVNRNPCKLLSDRSANLDVGRALRIQASDYSSQSALIKQVLKAQTLCLSMPCAILTGKFGELITEATVSGNLSIQYPYRFFQYVRPASP